MAKHDQQSAAEQVEAVARSGARSKDLRITDLRVAVVASNYDYPIIRIDTNQGLYGIGEVRDAGHKESVLQFKSMILGQNPCNLDLIFRAIKPFGAPGREGGGVSGLELALWDLIGKIYEVPCWQFLGGKYRERIRIYADTPAPKDDSPEGYAQAVLERKARGITFIKFDIRPSLFEQREGSLYGQPTRGEHLLGRRVAPGSGPGPRLSARGIAQAAEVVAAVREAAGDEISLCIDHFGHGYLTAKEVIRLANALEGYGLAWMEDPMPWWDIEAHKRVADAIGVPIAAGEELYLLEGFAEVIETRAFDILHPDLLTAGGMRETKRIADAAEDHNIPTALHFAGSPIAFMANVHTAAAISSFVALEHHGLDLPFWEHLVTGLRPDYLHDGYVEVPDAPGLGVDLNEEAIEANLRTPGTRFLSTEEWNTPKLGFWRPDNRWEE